MIQARVLNWRQLEKLQLVLIERIMDLSNVHQSELIIYLSQFDFPGTRAEVVASVSSYLNKILERVLKPAAEAAKTRP